MSDCWCLKVLQWPAARWTWGPCKLISERNGGDISKVSIFLADCKEDDKKTKGPVSTTAEEAQTIDDRGNDLKSDQPAAKWRKVEAVSDNTCMPVEQCPVTIEKWQM